MRLTRGGRLLSPRSKASGIFPLPIYPQLPDSYQRRPTCSLAARRDLLEETVKLNEKHCRARHARRDSCSNWSPAAQRSIGIHLLIGPPNWQYAQPSGTRPVLLFLDRHPDDVNVGGELPLTRRCCIRPNALEEG